MKRSPQVLVIDDEPQLLELLALTLHLAGFDVKSALTGLEHARQTSFDLIVLGTLTAPWDGLETARQLRLLSCCAPIIFLGGVPGKAGPYESRPYESRPEAAPRLPKPFRTSQLIALVEATLPPGLQPRS